MNNAVTESSEINNAKTAVDRLIGPDITLINEKAPASVAAGRAHQQDIPEHRRGAHLLGERSICRSTSPTRENRPVQPHVAARMACASAVKHVHAGPAATRRAHWMIGWRRGANVIPETCGTTTSPVLLEVTLALARRAAAAVATMGATRRIWREALSRLSDPVATSAALVRTRSLSPRASCSQRQCSGTYRCWYRRTARHCLGRGPGPRGPVHPFSLISASRRRRTGESCAVTSA